MSNAESITLTPRAIEMGKQKVADADTPVEGLRLGIMGGGCSGYFEHESAAAGSRLRARLF